MPLAADFRSRLEAVLACPTAPFHEGRVHSVIRAAVAESPRLRDRVDAHGNLLVVYGRGRPRLLFACHTDHPALEANGDGTATIRGGLDPGRLAGTGLRLLGAPDRVAEAGGAVRGREKVVRLRGARGLRKGTPLLLDLPDYRLTKRHVRARAIDDLCAVAAVLTLFDRLASARWPGTVGALFTRAEEVGFAGALAWTRTTRTPKTTTIVNLEMSPERRHTPQGQGPILRVGDRVRTFDPAVAAELEAVALTLAKREKDFRHQRALMDGGACEATPYSVAGFRTGALCLPLRNYHNHTARGMGLEYVHAADAANLVRWMVAYARAFGRVRAGGTEARLEKLWRRNRSRLARTAAEGRGR